MQVWVSSPTTYEDDEGTVDSRGWSYLAKTPSPIRVLLALDNERDGECLLSHVKLLASTGDVSVRVLHVVEQATVVGFSAIETTADAQVLVSRATFSLQMAGVEASGVLRSARIDRIGLAVLEEASGWRANTIVLNGPRTRGVRALLSRGVREQVLRRSTVPVALVSTLPSGIANGGPTQSRLGSPGSVGAE
jgi:nucleotide-binding universal stress UspA family protein